MVKFPHSLTEVMKLKSSLFFLLILGSVCVGAIFPKLVDSKEKEVVIFEAVMDVLNRGHFKPIEINDDVSLKVYDSYLESIDRGKRFLTQEDLAQLSPYKQKLDDEAHARTFEFFELSLGILDNGIEKTQSIYEEILAQPFDLTIDEKVELDNDKKKFATNDAELKEFWRKTLKYEVLNRILNKLDDQEKEEKEESVENKEDTTRAPAASTKSQKNMKRGKKISVNENQKSDKLKMKTSHIKKKMGKTTIEEIKDSGKNNVKVMAKFKKAESGTQVEAIKVKKAEIVAAQEKNSKNSNSKDSKEIKTLEELEVEAREEVKEVFDDWFKRMSKLKRSDRFEAYLNAFTHQFDPHSDYFNPKEKQDFDINMGGKLEGIGARLQQDGDYVKVSSIVPGGPAWKGKDLEVDDLIMTVTQKGGEPLDITGMLVRDVVTHIRGKKGTVVTLHVKRADGTEADVEIERDEVILDESFARSVILDMPGKVENVGYIKLPKFYSSFEKEDGNSCAVDVQKEINKLKDENVDGIVLDLRWNTGGSLNDVVSMSGLFIEDGPIVQVKPRAKAPYVYDDPDGGVEWDKPLIVMVNAYSASASEILAAALQDYNRAIIVGSNSTFGKGTVQRFYDLDNFVKGSNVMKPLGQVKLTLQKFFRINGGSTQLRGVEPDIILPDQYSYIDVGEKEYDDAMPWTEIDALDYGQEAYKISNKSDYKTRSQSRIAQNDKFRLIDENAKRLKSNKDQSMYSLNLDAYKKEMDARKKEAEKFEDILEEDIQGLQAKNLNVDLDNINSDESKQVRNEEWVKNIKKDVYIEEVLYIMRDMLQAS